MWVGALFWMGSVLAQPDNDTFDRREVLQGPRLTVRGTTTDSTRDRFEAELTGAQVGQGVVWWEWVAPLSGPVTVTLDGNFGGFRGRFLFFEGATAESLRLVGERTGSGTVVVPVESGRRYTMAAVSGTTYSETFQIHLALPVAPPNDTWSGATVLDGDWMAVRGTLLDATPDVDGRAPQVWWRWTAPHSGMAVLQSPPSGLMLSAWREDQEPAIDRPLTQSRYLWSTVPSEAGPLLSQVWRVEAGQTYRIAAEANPGLGIEDFELRLQLTRVSIEADREAIPLGGSLALRIRIPPEMGLGWSQGVVSVNDGTFLTNRDVMTPFLWKPSREGRFRVTAAVDDHQGRRWVATNQLEVVVLGPLAVANDRFEDRILLPAQTNFFVQPGWATVDPGEPLPGGGSLWYEWQASVDGRMVVSVSKNIGEEFQVTAFSGPTLESLETLPFQSDTDPWLRNWSLQVRAGQRGFLRMTSSGANRNASFGVAFAIGAIPGNDEFQNRAVLPSGSFRVEGNNSVATRELDEPSQMRKSVWYDWTAPAEGTLSLVYPSLYEHQVRLYSGTRWPPSIQVPNQWRSSTVGQFLVTEGVHYSICLLGSQSPFNFPYLDGGPFVLEGTFAPSPPNDGFFSPLTLSGDDLRFEGSLAGAQPTTSRTFVRPEFRYLWYDWAAAVDGQVVVSVSSGFQGEVVGVNLDAQDVPLPMERISGQVAFSVRGGSRYRIGIGNAFGGADVFEAILRVRRPAVNDLFADRIPISGLREQLRGPSPGSSLEEEPTGFPPFSGSLWWTWTAPRSGWVALRSRSLMGVRVFTGDALRSLSEVAVTTDPEDANGQETRFDATAGVSYQIAVRTDPRQPFDEIVDLDLSTFVIASPRPADVFLYGLDASVSANPPDPDVDGILVGPVTVEGGYIGSRPSTLGVLTSLPGSTTVKPVYIPGVSLRLRATNAAGEVRLSRPVQVPVRPSNDDFARALRIEGIQGTGQATLAGTTLEPREPGPGQAEGWGSVWMQWRAPATGTLWFRSKASSNKTNNVQVFRGSSLAGLREVPATRDRDGIAAPVDRNVEYWIRVAGVVDGNFGTFDWESWPFRIVIPVSGNLRKSDLYYELLADVPASDIAEVYYVTAEEMLGPMTRPPWRVVPNRLPALGEVTLNAMVWFQDGTQSSFPATATVQWRPDNDDLAHAIPVREGFLDTVGTGGATLEPGEPAAPAGSGSLWWTFEPLGDGYLRMSTDNATYLLEAFQAPRIDSWAGAVKLSGPVAGSDLEVRGGQKYLIRLLSPQPGAVTLFMNFSRVGTNQTPETAAELPGADIPFRAEFGPTLGSGASRFWWFVPKRSGVAYFESSGPTAGTYYWRLHPDGVRDDTHPFFWPNHYAVEAGSRYLVESWLPPGNFGTWEGSLRIQDANFNDQFSRSWPVPEEGMNRRFFFGEVPSDSAEPVLPPASDPGSRRSLWFSWTSPRRQYVTFWSSTVAPLAVFEGDSLATLWPIAQSDWIPIQFLAEGGRTYSLLLQQTGFVNWGTTVGIDPLPPPPHDGFDSRGRVSGFDATLEFETLGATREPDEPWHADVISLGATWWSWTAPARGRVTLKREQGVNNPFLLAVYRGLNLADLVPIANSGEPGNGRSLQISVHAGEELQIAGTPTEPSYYGFQVPERWFLEFQPESDPLEDLILSPLGDHLELQWPGTHPGAVLEATESLKNPSWQPLDVGDGSPLRLPWPESGSRFFRIRTQ